MRSFAVLFRFLVLLFALGTALAGLVAQGGRWSDRLDVITHFAPFGLAAAVLALLLWLAGGRRGRASPMLALVGLVAFGSLMAGEFLPRKAPPPADGGEVLKVVQFNAWARNRAPGLSAEWILRENPDIVVIEEAYGLERDDRRALMNRYPHRTTCGEPDPCATFILSKQPPLAEGGMRHVGGPGLSGAWATFAGRSGRYTVVGIHYTWPIPAGPQQAQSRILAEFMEPFAKDRLIVAGDFNSTPWSFSLKRQDARFGLERRTRAIPTWPAAPVSRWKIASPLPFLPIDHVYAGPGWRTLEVRRGPRLGSDHFPLVVTLQAAPDQKRG